MSPDIRWRAHVCRTVARSDLHDVLGLSARETANVLETTPVSIDSALQRAHKTVDDRLPRHSQQQTLRLLGDEQLSDLVERYITAWEAKRRRRRRLNARRRRHNRDDVAAELVQRPRPGRRLPARLPAARCPALDDGSDLGKRAASACLLRVERANLRVHAPQHQRLTLRGGQVEEIMAFLNPKLLEPLGCPFRSDDQGSRHPAPTELGRGRCYRSVFFPQRSRHHPAMSTTDPANTRTGVPTSPAKAVRPARRFHRRRPSDPRGAREP